MYKCDIHMYTLYYIIFFANLVKHRMQFSSLAYSAKSVALYPGKNCLVHTVCACTQFPRISENHITLQD